ncbi:MULTISPECIES: threonine/serine exporter family protein [Bacillaceae]|uniref:Threonine/serine exporter ThrE family protein n=1 Tax=Evansella alkalicola TaxID=745819 RepID=A0ABS6JY28_9BACI|nr:MULTISPECIES: threonine/serine exporter ThrE family protein [Bacillaceae]MBU9722010.1 threonine/serine exporter ThrE family protein [Bacillus alkalicola]
MGKADDVMDICMLAGEIMLTYGAETYRVEETLERIAKSASFKNVHCFATATGIFLSFEENKEKDDLMQMVRIDDRMQDLNKVTEVNQVSREFVSGELSIPDAHEKLLAISKAPMQYPLWVIHLAAGFAGSGFSYLFGGGWFDLIPAFIAAVISSLIVVELERHLKVRFAAEFTAAFSGGSVAILLVFIGLGNNLDQIIIGSLMPLVPGVPLTNAVRDLMSGDLLAGMARGAEALVTSLAIASGIALTISIFL